ncbi:MAG: class I SAM-dependent methyltransferase [Bacteroidales bacterium]|nr:class I SAM-dependent methyltransferase [Bacteroidales bacterium]MBN2818753.1 class I SAM-dependent methyltransferase [Bacteroidales bacterium]
MVNFSDKIFASLSLLKHFLLSKHRKGRGIHSPAAFELVSKVIFQKLHKSEPDDVSEIIEEIKKDTRIVEFTEYGAGSSNFGKKDNRVIGKIARNAGIKAKYGELLYKAISYYKPSTILEIGTSAGISTLYMANAMPENCSLFTLEGNSAVQHVAKEYLNKLNAQGIHFICGNFDDEIPRFLGQYKPDFVFVDGNHTYQATINYYKQLAAAMNRGIIVFDDIYWSRGMGKAWKEIGERSDIAVDIYSMGIVIIGEMLTPGYYRVRF